jgi:hypothetical protein
VSRNKNSSSGIILLGLLLILGAIGVIFIYSRWLIKTKLLILPFKAITIISFIYFISYRYLIVNPSSNGFQFFIDLTFIVLVAIIPQAIVTLICLGFSELLTRLNIFRRAI